MNAIAHNPDPAPCKGHIQVRGFGLSYPTVDGDVQAVSHVDLDVQPGEFVSILGPSGCGKSTLLNALAGFLKPTRGAVEVDGAPIDGPGADRGMIFQHYSLFPWMTVVENVEFGLKMKGIERGQRRAAARTLLGLTGLSDFENHYPDRLSGGMKQRVGIVRALATGPRILLLDEPFGALDAQTRLIMQQILTNIWQQLRISVLFVTHDIDEAVFLSDRIYVMSAKPGSIKAEVRVPLQRPRDPQVVVDPTFVRLRAELMALIREESLKAMGGELNPEALKGISVNLGGRDLSEVV